MVVGMGSFVDEGQGWPQWNPSHSLAESAQEIGNEVHGKKGVTETCGRQEGVSAPSDNEP